MPFGEYKDFKDCVEQNSCKENPEAFCAYLHHKVTGTWPGEHEMAAATTSAKTLDNVEVFAKGTWTDSSGTTCTFADKDLDAIVKNFQAGAALKVGHSADDFSRGVAQALGVPIETVTGERGTGQGAVGLGKMVSLKRVGERLVAKFHDVPDKIVKMIQDKLYTSVSAELTEHKDGSYSIEGVALLGAQRPALAPLEGRLQAACAFCFEKKLAQPTIADVRPVLGDTKKKKLQEGKMPPEVTTQAPAEGAGTPDIQAALKAIAEALGLDAATAKVEDIVNAVKALKGEAPGNPDSAAQAATGPMMAKFEAASARVAELEKENAGLQRDKRIIAFTARAAHWKSFIADTDKEVQSLVDMPEATAEVIAKSYDHCYEVMAKSQFFEKIGPAANKNTEAPVHEFVAKVLKYAADNKLTKDEAMLKLQTEDKPGFESFMEFSRRENYLSYNSLFGKTPEKK